MPHYTLYQIVCEATGRSYIGCTTGRVARRIEVHLKRPANQHLKHDLDLYGPKAFSVFILDVQDDVFDARRREEELIQEYGALYPTGYNICPKSSMSISKLLSPRYATNLAAE